MIRNHRGQQADRTTVSIIEDYVRGLPSGTWATPKMVGMNAGIPASRANAFLSYLCKRGVLERKTNAEGHFIYKPGPRNVDRVFAKKAEKAEKAGRPHLTRTGVELRVAPKPPVEARLGAIPPELSGAFLALLVAEFGLETWLVDGNPVLRTKS